MGKKDILIKQSVKILEMPRVRKWYSENLETTGQEETIDRVKNGFHKGELTIEEALTIVFIVGYQWNVKFEGVP